MNNAGDICRDVPVWACIFISPGKILESGIAGTNSKSMFKLLKSCQTEFQNVYHFTFPLAITEGSSVSTRCQHMSLPNFQGTIDLIFCPVFN